jgi:ABC-type sulfate/molybdate transport systems ATPase subunit
MVQVAHDPIEAMNLADRTTGMKDGIVQRRVPFHDSEATCRVHREAAPAPGIPCRS